MQESMVRREILSEMMFALGETAACLKTAEKVSLPHTWSLDQEKASQRKGWYRTVLPANGRKVGERTFLYIRGAYRDTTVCVNGKEVSKHMGSGYTPFLTELPLTDGGLDETEIVISVDNSFSTDALPCGRSFDWADDGGLFRPVECWTTGPVAISDVRITARPVILPNGLRQNKGAAVFGFRAVLDGGVPCELAWALSDEATGETVASGTEQGMDEIRLSPMLLERSVQYWHFDDPKLYTLSIRVLTDQAVSDVWEKSIGFREMTVRGEQWFFNGEPVRLPGLEWMPGSSPDVGMAESREALEHMLARLRETNTVITRFHWQQDDWVYDWCDRHGLLVQEEVPFWGKTGDPDVLYDVAIGQLREMIRWHGHHPSIIAWGVGNELAGDTWPVMHYVRKACAYAKALDPDRLANYVTNTGFACPAADATGAGDVLMINDYIGTWHQGFEQGTAWKSLTDANPGRIFVPSEFGLCEPAFKGGDPERIRIFREKLAFYRSCPQIAGTVCFCLNDYRTHMGEEGEGRFRRRVHGSLTLEGGEKPSYAVICSEYAPIRVERTADGLLVSVADSIPSYTVQGYEILSEGRRIGIPALKPGESWRCSGVTGIGRIVRKNGDPVLEF